MQEAQLLREPFGVPHRETTDFDRRPARRLEAPTVTAVRRPDCLGRPAGYGFARTVDVIRTEHTGIRRVESGISTKRQLQAGEVP